MIIDDTGSVEDIHAFIYCKKWKFGQVLPMPHSLTTLKDSATQLLIKYKSGALVTQQVQILQNLALSGSKYSTIHWVEHFNFIPRAFSWKISFAIIFDEMIPLMHTKYSMLCKKIRATEAAERCSLNSWLLATKGWITKRR